MTATRTIASASWRDVAETLSPRASAQEDGLPPLLIVLTVVTGVVDALAYLRLGHVFVANMTGNVVFLGFAAGGASGLSVPGSLLALACFLPGGIAAGRLAAVSAMTGAATSAWRPRSSSRSVGWRFRSPPCRVSTSARAAVTPSSG